MKKLLVLIFGTMFLLTAVARAEFMVNELLGFNVGGVGGNDANTVLLTHADGTDASTTFTDVSASAHTLTANGNAQVDTAQSVFGGASLLLDGTGDWLAAPDHAAWNFGTSSFTIDMRVRYNSLAATGTIVAQGTDASNGFRLRTLTTGVLVFEVWAAGAKVVDFSSAAATVTTGAWYHIALVRNGNDWNIYKDGTSVASVTDADSIGNYTGTLRFGNDAPLGAGFGHNGWMDEIRVSNVARWTTAFSPAAEAYE